MTQTRTASLIEALLNVAVGFVVSALLTAVVMPAYGHDVTWSQNLQITAIFTAASIARSYLLRRYFNGQLARAARALTRSAA